MDQGLSFIKKLLIKEVKVFLKNYLELVFDLTLLLLGEPITASQYFGVGRVTEFKYGINLYNNKDNPQVS